MPTVPTPGSASRKRKSRTVAEGKEESKTETAAAGGTAAATTAVAGAAPRPGMTKAEQKRMLTESARLWVQQEELRKKQQRNSMGGAVAAVAAPTPTTATTNRRSSTSAATTSAADNARGKRHASKTTSVVAQPKAAAVGASIPTPQARMETEEGDDEEEDDEEEEQEEEDERDRKRRRVASSPAEPSVATAAAPRGASGLTKAEKAAIRASLAEQFKSGLSSSSKKQQSSVQRIVAVPPPAPAPVKPAPPPPQRLQPPPLPPPESTAAVAQNQSPIPNANSNAHGRGNLASMATASTAFQVQHPQNPTAPFLQQPPASVTARAQAWNHLAAVNQGGVVNSTTISSTMPARPPSFGTANATAHQIANQNGGEPTQQQQQQQQQQQHHVPKPAYGRLSNSNKPFFGSPVPQQRRTSFTGVDSGTLSMSPNLQMPNDFGSKAPPATTALRPHFANDHRPLQSNKNNNEDDEDSDESYNSKDAINDDDEDDDLEEVLKIDDEEDEEEEEQSDRRQFPTYRNDFAADMVPDENVHQSKSSRWRWAVVGIGGVLLSIVVGAAVHSGALLLASKKTHVPTRLTCFQDRPVFEEFGGGAEVAPHCHNVTTDQLVSCPPHARCRGGVIESCESHHYDLLPAACVLSQTSNETVKAMVDKLREWTIAYHCGNNPYTVLYTDPATLDSSKLLHTKGFPLSAEGSPTATRKRPFFLYSQLSGELEMGYDLNLIKAVNADRDDGGLFVLYYEEPEVLIGLHPSHLVALPLTCKLKHALTAVFGLTLSSVLYVLMFVCKWYWDWMVAYPAVTVGFSLVAAGVIHYIQRKKRRLAEQGKLMAEVLSVRQDVWNRLASQPGQVVVSLHLRDSIVWERYQTSSSGRQYLIQKIWPRICDDIRQDNRIRRSFASISGKSVEQWQWIDTSGAGGLTSQGPASAVTTRAGSTHSQPRVTFAD